MLRSVPVLLCCLVLSGCVRTRTIEVPQPYPVPTLVDRPVVVEDSALVSVLSEYVRRRESHPVVFDVRTGRFRLPPATPAEQAQIIAAELAWYELWVRDVVEWMRSRIE